MPPDTKRKGLGTDSEAPPKPIHHLEDLPTTLLEAVDTLDEIAHHIDGAFVVVVAVTGGKYKRRCYLTAASAERAAGRATARGENATVYLAELRPLFRLRGGEAG